MIQEPYFPGLDPVKPAADCPLSREHLEALVWTSQAYREKAFSTFTVRLPRDGAAFLLTLLHSQWNQLRESPSGLKGSPEFGYELAALISTVEQSLAVDAEIALLPEDGV